MHSKISKTFAVKQLKNLNKNETSTSYLSQNVSISVRLQKMRTEETTQLDKPGLYSHCRTFYLN